MLQLADPKIVVVTRQTRLQALKAKFSTRGMAKFAMVRSREIERVFAAAPLPPEKELAAEFDDIESEDSRYRSAVEQMRDELDLKNLGLKVQTIDREFIPNFVFGPRDIVVTLGQDGLVANTAKYAVGLPIVAVNPDPKRIDGILLPFQVSEARAAVRAVIAGRAKRREVALAEVRLTDGQRMLAFNDFFIGMRSHVSARYRIRDGKRAEDQSSSGVLISTGAGSTGWLSSIFNMVNGVDRALKRDEIINKPPRIEWEDARLFYVVREPFASKTSGASIVAGTIEPNTELVIESMMASGGAVFSDGIESDYLEFNSGTTARIHTADKRAQLVVP